LFIRLIINNVTMSGQAALPGHTGNEPIAFIPRLIRFVCCFLAVAAGSGFGVVVGGSIGFFSGWLGGQLTNAFSGSKDFAVVNACEVQGARFGGGTGGLIGAACVMLLIREFMSYLL
jgi:hypothetical protein